MGDGAVAFAARPGALVWKSDQPCGNRFANLISAAALLHAGMGGNSNFARTNNSISVAGAYRKHSRYAHSTGIDIDYTYEIANLWVDPWTRFRQIALVLLVWGHFAVGLHFWWRLYGWYRRAFPVFLLAYVLIPTAALLGFAEVGMKMTAHARSDPQWMRAIKARGVPADPNRAKLRATLKDWVGPYWFGVVGFVVCIAQIRNWRERRARFRVTYPDNVTIEAPKGMSVLEVSWMARRPHMSVCGGRARCTTCRVKIASAAGELPEPSELEAAALRRIGAPSNVRLACQLRPEVDVTVQPLLQPSVVAARHTQAGQEFGEEREVTILFVDIRGSTSLAETRLP